MNKQWVVDLLDDANGHCTIRLANGTVHGNTDEQPIATVYDRDLAEHIVSVHNASLTKRKVK